MVVSARGAQTRREILDAAVALVSERGYGRTSVREIARTAGVSQAGLLHHFGSKEAVFLEVLRRRDDLEGARGRAVRKLTDAVGSNAGEPGAVRLYVVLSAESTTSPGAGRFFRERFRRLREALREDPDCAGGRLTPDSVAMLLIAAADGLQVQWLLDPSVAMRRRLELLQAILAGAATPPSPAGRSRSRLGSTGTPASDALRDYDRGMATRGPYAKGVAKREEILDVALRLFAQKGYDRTSVREIARETGLSQAGLLHHFATKEDLFLEVLRRRDERDGDPAGGRHVHSVDALISAVANNASEPGLVRLFVLMSAEAAEEGSRGGAWFADRYRWLLEQIADDVRRHQATGAVDPDLDPADVASLLVAVADGLQLQWLLDPEGVDMAQRLEQLWRLLRRD